MHTLIRNSISIKFKAMGTLGLTLCIFILGYFVFQRILNKKNDLAQAIQRNELIESTSAILKTRNDMYEKMVFDYAVFSWMVDFIRHPNKAEGEQTISHPQSIGFDLIQIYNLDRHLVYKDLDSDVNDTLSIAAAVFDTLYRARKLDFFIKTKYGLVQLIGSTVHPSGDLNQQSAPGGFIFFGKIWDPEYMNTLKKVINSNIELQFSNNTLDNQPNKGKEIFLSDYKSNHIAHFNIIKTDAFLENIKGLNVYFNIFFISFCFVLLVIIYRHFNVLVISPLQKIERTLNEENPSFIKKLSTRKDEFGKIALLIDSFFQQNGELNGKIDELKKTQQLLSELNREMQIRNDEVISTADGLQLANLEITESINYASFIQKAVLAPSHELSRTFPEHFIFYKPRNIVSGDFYWFKEMRNGERIFAVADCTGHGLSGSLLSMLGVSFLNQVISQYEDEEYTAATILDNLKYLFIEALHQGGEVDYVQDGMHIALCIFDKECRSMQYTTAFHTICLVRRNPETNLPELTELKGNRIPVGIYITDEQFTNHTIDIKKGDLLYMFSDGYPDQFGGPYNKKFLPNRLRNMLLSNSGLPLGEQKEKIISTFESWKGHGEQTDDVIVAGIKIP
ncbi:MAG TPA: SpoIIE family protein phosphatase [Bacteroidales bacterium]